MTESRQETLNGKTVYASNATIAPGESVTYSFDVTTSTKAVSDLTIDQTPMGWIDSGVTTDTAACSIKVVPEFLRTLVFARPRGDDQFADCTFSPSLDMSR